MATVTPFALSVKLGMRSNSMDTLVQTVNQTGWNDWAVTSTACDEVVTQDVDIQCLLTSVFSSSAIKPQSALFPNASYNMEFWGPFYSCQNLSDTIAA